MQKLLTIAVPCYNVEWCLEKCLSSFVDERILDKLQAIIVNDGGTDRTVDIADRFIEQYPDTFSLIDKKNGGHGSTINAAIGKAEGKYFKVVDADDWVITDNLVELVNILETTQADAVVTNYHMVDMETGALKEFRITNAQCGTVYSLNSYLQLPRESLDCFTFHGLFFRIDVYRKSGAVMSEKIFYEDQEYATLPFRAVETVLPLDLFIYQYLVGNGNQSVADHNQVNRIGHVEQVLDKLVASYTQYTEMTESAKKYFLRKIADLLLSLYIICLIKNPDKKAGRREAFRIREKLLKQCPEAITLTDQKRKAACIMNRFHISSRQYEWLLQSSLYSLLRHLIRKN